MTSRDIESNVQAADLGGIDSGRMPWKAFVVRRLGTLPLVIIGVTFLVFVVVDLSPNDPAVAVLGWQADAEEREAFAALHGLDDPLLIRYARFLGDTAQLDLGDSPTRPESVAELVGNSLPVTMQLVLLASTMAIVAALVIGVWAACREGGPFDSFVRGVAALFQASPPFWVGVMAVQFFAVRLDWVPAGGYVPFSEGASEWFRTIIAPATVLALPVAAAMTRVMRSAMTEELEKDYVRTAVGAGVAWPEVVYRNVVRNALIAPVTVLGLYIGAMLSGTILIETVFNLPGLGRLLVQGVNEGDLAIVRAVALVGATGFVLINIAVDFLSRLLNPKSAEALGTR